MDGSIAILTPASLLKTVRNILASKDLLAGNVIDAGENVAGVRKGLLVVTTLQQDAAQEVVASDERELWVQLGLVHVKEELSIRVIGPKKSLPHFWRKLHDQLLKFLLQNPLPPQQHATINVDNSDDNTLYLSSRDTDEDILVKNIPSNFKYDIYPPLLLLPPSSPFVAAPIWEAYIASLNVKRKTEFFALIADCFKVTHIAINAPIPTEDNLIRRPLITPLYGNFDDEFWVSTTQNGIYQTWSPMHTMFSRGNIREKTRILDKVSADTDKNFAAVDLYVGIGYFTFSYLKAGAKLVLGWDINEWSIEGCRRGAIANGWPARVTTEGHDMAVSTVKSNLLLFHESNIYAPDRIRKIGSMPPVRYINLGLLPTSRPSYAQATQILLMNDPPVDGTIFVHENVGQSELERKKGEIVEIFKTIMVEGGGGRHWTVNCQHIEKVKSWAPGVFHCVFDIVLLYSNESSLK